MNPTTYYHLATVLEYPVDDLPERVNQCEKWLKEHFPKAAEEFEPFAAFIRAADHKTIEEVYTRTFDVQAICSLDIGYILFGEEYKRGAVLANLANEHNKTGNNTHNELADFLPNVLRLLPKMDDEETLYELVGMIIVPALEKTLGEFGENKIKAKEKVYQKHHQTVLERPAQNGLIYYHPLKALLHVLKADFPELSRIEQEMKKETPSQGKEFISSIQTEMRNEDEE